MPEVKIKIYIVALDADMECRTVSGEIPTEITGLYAESFSETEKIPIKNLERTLDRGGEMLRFESEGEFVGFTFSFLDENIRFLVYFAIRADLRSKGYGTGISDMFLKKHSGEKIFLVVEPLDENSADSETRMRRQEFYRRNGFRLAGYQVVSDDYPFDVMTVNGDVDCETAKRVVKRYEDIHNGLL